MADVSADTESDIKTEVVDESAENNDSTCFEGMNGEVKSEIEVKQEDAESAGTDTKIFHRVNNFKVKVSNLPKWYPLSEFKKIVKEDLGLALSYIRSPKKSNPWLHLIFSTEEEQKKAVKALHKYSYKNRPLNCAVVTSDPLKRKLEEMGDLSDAKKAKLDMPLEERILMLNIPYHDLPYEEQLKKKSDEIKTTVSRLGELIVKRNAALAGWAEQQAEKNNGLPLSLEEIKPSPILDGYRNKSEFRVGLNPDTKERTVGCRMENYKDGTIGVGPASSLKHLPEQMREIVKTFENYVKQSEYGPFMAETGEGYWRHIVVRMNSTGETMLTIVMHPQSLTEEQLVALKESIKDYFVNGEGKEFNITSIYFQIFAEKMVGQPPPEAELLYGTTHLEEKLFDLKFHLSPSSYFHVNVKGAEVLYEAIMELVEPTEETVVLDLCCGTGGIGLCIANKCGQVYGIEFLSNNVEDAKKNAEANEITNCEFFSGKVEDILPTLEEKIKGKNVVPVLDPPRTGLNQKVLSQLRKMEAVQKIIYVCSNHKAPLRNFLDLSAPEGKGVWSGNPFVPVKAIPVDLTPYSMHCHMIILLERVDPSTLPKPKNPVPAKKKVLTRSFRRGGRPQGPIGKGRRGRPYPFRGGLRGRGRGGAPGPRGRGPLVPPISFMGRPSPSDMPPYRRNLLLEEYAADPYMERDYYPPVMDPYMRRRRMMSEEAVLNRYSSLRRDFEEVMDAFAPRMYRPRSFAMNDDFYMDSPYAAALEREDMAYRAEVSRGYGGSGYGSMSNQYSQFGKNPAPRRRGGGGGGSGPRGGRGGGGKGRRGFGRKK